jgi:hypothetical protein
MRSSQIWHSNLWGPAFWEIRGLRSHLVLGAASAFGGDSGWTWAGFGGVWVLWLPKGVAWM